MMKKLLTIFSLFIISMLISATDQGGNKSEKPPEKKITIAVVQPQILSEDKADSSLGPILSAFLIDGLNKSPALKVIDLGMNDQIEKLLAFANSDMCDKTQCQIPVGNLTSAQKLLAGTVARLGDKYVMSARLIDIEKGVVEFSAKEQIVGKKEDLDQLAEMVALDLREHFGEKVKRPQPTGQSPQSNSSASTPDTSPQTPAPPPELDSDNLLGIKVVDMSNDPKWSGKGVMVESISENSPCLGSLAKGNIIFYMDPALDKDPKREFKAEYYIHSLPNFRRVAAKLKPGDHVFFQLYTSQKALPNWWSGPTYVNCILP